VTGVTWAQLGGEFIARRVIRTRVVNIREPVDLYEVEAAGPEERRALKNLGDDLQHRCSIRRPLGGRYTDGQGDAGRGEG